MGEVAKIPTTHYFDSEGRRVKRGTPGAIAVKQKSRKWYGTYKDEHGVYRRKALGLDKDSAKRKLADLQRQAERRASGRIDGFDDALARPIAEHLAAFVTHLAGKGNTAGHVRDTGRYIEAVCNAAGVVFLRDLHSDRIEVGLASMRANRRSTALPKERADELRRLIVAGELSNSKIAKKLGVDRSTVARYAKIGVAENSEDAPPTTRGIRTMNGYLNAVKAFSTWCVATRRLPLDPLAHLKPQNETTDKRHDRRAISQQELANVLEAAQQSEHSFRGLSGPDRAMLYAMAIGTGFRAGELASLSRRSLRLDGDQPTVVVEAAYSKRRRRDEQPLPTWLAVRLTAWLESKQPSDSPTLKIDGVASAKLFPGSWRRKAAEMLRIDLAAAGIDYRDEFGQVFDFHAQRHQFVTLLSEAGVHPRKAQSLARHSSIELTMSRYTHLQSTDLAAALETVADPTTSPKRERATGTADARPLPPCSAAGDRHSDSGAHPDRAENVCAPVARNRGIPCPESAQNGKMGKIARLASDTDKTLAWQGLNVAEGTGLFSWPPERAG